MGYIKSLTIKGFKKFENMHIDFNQHMNILVGENEAGKSTILEAIRIVLRQENKNADKAILQDWFNLAMVQQFLQHPSLENLPHIILEVELVLDKYTKNAEYFFGEQYGDLQGNQECKCGIRFECSFDASLGEGLEDYIEHGKIPYEYYELKWITFANQFYQTLRLPINFIFIDTSNQDASYSYNRYNRSLLYSRYKKEEIIKAKNIFRESLTDSFKKVELEPINDNRHFGVNTKKILLENVISVLEDEIPLENKGSGMESLIKTQIALDRKSNLDVVLMEEPENHLCFSNLHAMLQQIEAQQDSSQIIITTHNNLIASRLNLKNIIWLLDNRARSLASIPEDIANFFMKAPDNSFLQLLLSKKAILVEGATEFLLIPRFYEELFNRTLEQDQITIISCNGLSFNKYLTAVQNTGKIIAVITDNDQNEKKIKEAADFNSCNRKEHIFMANDIKLWTWEVNLYEYNKEKIKQIIKVKQGANYKFHSIDFKEEPVLGKMLNNKVDSAYELLLKAESLVIPKYVKEALEWINKQS